MLRHFVDCRLSVHSVRLRRPIPPTMSPMSGRIDDRADLANPRQVLVARAILGLTILATAAGVTFEILDAQRGNGGGVFATGVLADLPLLVALVAFPLLRYH